MVRHILFLWVAWWSLGGCSPSPWTREAPKGGVEGGGVRVYEVGIDTMGTWVSSDVNVGRGATVAVMAAGRVWNWFDGRVWGPDRRLWFKVGKDGPRMWLWKGLDMAAVRTWKEGTLYFLVPEGNRPEKHRQTGGFSATILVWEEGQEGRVDRDLHMLARSHPESRQMRKLPYVMSLSFTAMGDYDSAEAILKKSREMEGGSSRLKALTFALSSRLAGLRGQWKRARDYATQAVKYAQRVRNRQARGVALVALGEAESGLGRHEAAIAHFERALKAVSNKEPSLAGEALLGIARSRLRLEDASDAAKRAEASLKHLEIQDASLARPQAYLTLAEAQLKLGLYREARNSIQSAERSGEALFMPGISWMAASQLARIAKKEGDASKAGIHCAEAIERFEETRRIFPDSPSASRRGEADAPLCSGLTRHLGRSHASGQDDGPGVRSAAASQGNRPDGGTARSREPSDQRRIRELVRITRLHAFLAGTRGGSKAFRDDPEEVRERAAEFRKLRSQLRGGREEAPRVPTTP